MTRKGAPKGRGIPRKTRAQFSGLKVTCRYRARVPYQSIHATTTSRVCNPKGASGPPPHSLDSAEALRHPSYTSIELPPIGDFDVLKDVFPGRRPTSRRSTSGVEAGGSKVPIRVTALTSKSYDGAFFF